MSDFARLGGLGKGGGGSIATLAEALAGIDNTKTITPLRLASVTQRIYNVKSYGAKGDGQVIFANITATQNTITAGTSVFVAGDVGKLIKIAGGGAANAPITTTITGYTSGTQVTIGTTITTSQTLAQIVWGTDDTAAIQSALNAAFDAGGGKVYLPNGMYLLNGALQTSVFGVNPNSQLYIKDAPIYTARTPRLELIGEAGNYLSLFPTGTMLYSLLTTGISGSNPAVIGSAASGAPPVDFNFVDFYMDNITLALYSNIYDDIAANPPYLSGINFQNQSKYYIQRVYITPYRPKASNPPPSPLTTNTFGFWGGRDGNETCNYFVNNQVFGFEYGAIIGDHTIMDGSSFVRNGNGIVPINLTHPINGKNVNASENKNAIYFPYGTFLGLVLSSNLRSVQLDLDYEYNSGTWYASQYIVDDVGVVGAGEITFSLFGTPIANAELLYNTAPNFPKFTLRHRGQTLPKVVSTGGSTGYNNLTAFTAVGYIAGQSIIESAAGSGGIGRMVVSSTAPGVNDYIGAFQAINGSGSASLNWGLYAKNNGATNTGATEEYLMNAGSFTQVSYTKNSDRAFLQPLVVGSLGGITNASVLLDLQSTTRAFKLAPATRASIVTGVTGMITNDANVPYFHNGTAWQQFHFRGDTLLVSQTTGGAFAQYNNSGNTITYAADFPTGATGASIGSFSQNIGIPSTIPNNSAVCFEIDVMGITPATGATGYYLKYQVAFRKDNAGTWTQIGAITTVIAVADAPYVPAAPTFSIATNTLTCNINFTGAVASRNYTVSVRLRTGQ